MKHKFFALIQTVLFDPDTRVRVDPGALAMKVLSAFVKAPALLEPHHQIA